MIFNKKILPIFIVFGIVVSSAYALVVSENKTMAKVNTNEVTANPTDTSKHVTPKFHIKKYTQNNYEELSTTYPMDAPMPKNIKSVVEYDAKSGNYLLRTFVGDMEIATPFMMTESEYRNYSEKKSLQNYWKEKRTKSVGNNEDKFSLSDMKFNVGPADKVFGPGGIQIKTQGSGELILGVKTSSINNPSLPLTARNRITPNFDFKLQFNVTGNVGDKMNFGLNYNTESSFSFDQQMVKLAYKGKEDDIIKSIEAGNVSLQLNSSLISGSTALFGVKTDLQFGKLSVSAIATQQKSESQTVSSKGGAQTTKFDVTADSYDYNRHFFLSHYFRDNYEKWMKDIPYVSSGITINRVEVWVTNKRGVFDQARNIVALMDLAEPDTIDNKYWKKTVGKKLAENAANNLYEEVSKIDGIRDVQTSNAVIADYISKNPITSMNGGEDYEKIESARKLDPNEYVVNKTIGTISLRNKLNPDEVLGVAYDYTYQGKNYQVGEFSTDNINNEAVTTAVKPSLIVKLLKGTAESPLLKIWDLMMKNVYDLGASQIQPENFKLNIMYRNDSIGTNLQYLTEGKCKNRTLLRVMNLDRLDTRNAPNRDGLFDFLEGYTVLANSGRIIIPVLEPFGKSLRDSVALNPKDSSDIYYKKFVYQQLYDSTVIVAQLYSDKNKFRLVGEYKSSSGAEIRLNAMNVPRGSVTVSAGGRTLVENTDYTVDYSMGVVTILNQSLIDAGTKIDARAESQSMFSNMQRKTLTGTHLEYKFNKDFSLGGTLMHLSEMPMTVKVNTGNEPISNTIWGMNTSWRGESQLLTNVLDKIPFVDVTKPSTIAVNAEFAQLIPGHSSTIDAGGANGGLAYIDDFESTRTSIDIHYPINWYLSSTPSGALSSKDKVLFPEATSSSIEYGKNRALLSWYRVEDVFFNSKSSTPGVPSYIQNDLELKSNHLTRAVSELEIFPKKTNLNKVNLTVFNLSYYPNERGPYNLVASELGSDGKLTNPKERWGGIMRKIDATDFEISNIEYIEFWMMNPFVNDKTGTDNGGDLYFNLGDISEDILKDGKKSFEHGLSIVGDTTSVDRTKWGKVPKTQSTINAFDNTKGARIYQDLGLDGLSNSDELNFPVYSDYVAEVKKKITDPAVLQKMQDDPFSPLNDPAGDNFHYFRGTDYDAKKLDVISRYKYFNGTEGNSPENSNDNTTNSATALPDMEDINLDNTMNEYERYFQYKVSLRPNSMKVGSNYITNEIESDVTLANGRVDKVKWYQFKIPIRTDSVMKIGGISNFKSIRFMRMFLTGFEKETHLRFATLELVRGEWRNYTKDLYEIGKTPATNGTLDVQAVNVEVNSDKTPVNYILPPGITRLADPGQPQLKQNEQSLALVVKNLSPGDAKGVYKITSYNMRQYKRMQMFVHAEKLTGDVTNLKDYELTCFVRLGTDMVNNYYEYEIPLRLTPGEVLYSEKNVAHQNIVWYPENMFDFSFETLTNAKLSRNKALLSNPALANQLFTIYDADPAKQANRITIKGNPTISDVQTIMIGVRNGSSTVKSGEIWVNELRMSQFEESGGWAAMGNMALGLSDLGSVNVAGRTETQGFGSVESNVMNRRIDDLYQLNFSTTLELGRFLPEQAKLQIPAYFSYTNETVSPKYNPLDQDVLFNDAINSLPKTNVSDKERVLTQDSLKSIAQTVNTSRSFTVSNAKLNLKSKTPMFYDPANVAVSYSLSESNKQSTDIEKNYVKNEKAGVNYSYSFNSQPAEPFKNVKLFDNQFLKIVKEFNFNYLPSSLSYNTNLNRQFTQLALRDLNRTANGSTMDLNYSHNFMWNRQFDFKYDISRALKLSLQTAMNATIEEPNAYVPEIFKSQDKYVYWRDSVMSNIRKLGNPFTYQQVFTASWSVPVNKLPMMDWTTANASYNSTYDWNRTAKLQSGKDVGNVASTMGSWQADGQLNFETLYNKSKYLKDVNKKFASQPGTKQKFQSKTYKQTVNLQKNKPLSINHRLGSEKLKITAIDKNGKLVLLSFKPKNVTTVDVTPQFDADSISINIITLNPEDQSVARSTLDFAVRSLMMVRRASATYRESSSMVLPGFMNSPEFLGQSNESPGYPFAFGYHDDNTIKNALSKKWLLQSGDSVVVAPATEAFTKDLDIKASIEPIPSLKIDLNAKYYVAKNTTIQYLYKDSLTGGMPTNYTGSYNITMVALSTAFIPLGTAKDNYNSPVFNKFLQNRDIIKNRISSHYVNSKYPNAGFLSEKTSVGGQDYDPTKGTLNLNSADVLIPSFLAAYTGADANSIATSPFLSMLSVLPNWRVSYDGLSRIQWVKDNFKSISLSHAYTCRYSIGAYTSYTTWVAMGEDDPFGYVRDVQSGNPLPSSAFDISSVSLNEQFSPLFGANAVMNNSMTAKVEFRKQRNLSLNLSSTQLIEAASDEYVVGFGYVLKDFDVILRLKSDKQTQLKNDLKISADLSYKDIKTLLRKVQENITQVSTGNKLFTLKLIADYVFSSKVNIQLFYDRQSSSPLVSSSFPVASSNFGLSLKFMLTR